MEFKSLRRVAILFVVFALGFVAGQVVISLDIQARNRARQVALVEGTVRSEESLSRLDELEELGYVEGTVDPHAELRGVQVHDVARAFPGLNFYSSRIRTAARLIDNDGQEVYSWSYPGGDGWEHAELLPNGELIVVVNEDSVFKLDRSSNLLWRRKVEAHHDVGIALSGDIYVLTHERRLRADIHPEIPVVEDFIEVLSPDGEVRDRFSVLDAIRASPFAFLLASPRELPRGTGAADAEVDRPHLDMLHTNHIQVFDGSLAGRSRLFRAGNLLISMRTINTIAILEPETRRVLWVWGPTNLFRQHDPSLIENGHIIVFDNGHRRSQIVELDPLTFDVAWRYAPSHGFLSRFRGSVQRLPNGNTLITESDRGYVFEVTPDQEVVWRFANPDVNDAGLRIAIWRMTRFTPDQVPFLQAGPPT